MSLSAFFYYYFFLSIFSALKKYIGLLSRIYGLSYTIAIKTQHYRSWNFLHLRVRNTPLIVFCFSQITNPAYSCCFEIIMFLYIGIAFPLHNYQFVNMSSIDVHLFLFQIWDIEDQCCLFTASPKASGIRGDITACSYSSALKSLYIAADSMAVLSLKIRLAVLPLCRVPCSLNIIWQYTYIYWTISSLMVSKVLKPNKIADNFEDFPLKEQTSRFQPKDEYILIFVFFTAAP